MQLKKKRFLHTDSNTNRIFQSKPLRLSNLNQMGTSFKRGFNFDAQLNLWQQNQRQLFLAATTF